MASTQQALLPQGWTPAQLTTSPSAWYVAAAADVGVTSGAVTIWTEHRHNGRDLTGLGSPQFNPQGWPGNQPTITFGGNSLFVSGAPNTWPVNWTDAPAGTDAAFTILAVVQSTSSTPSETESIVGFWDLYGGSDVWLNLKQQDGRTLLDGMRKYSLGMAQAFETQHDLGSGPNAAPHVVAWRYSPASQTFTLSVDGTLSTSNALQPIQPLAAMPLIVGAGSLLPTYLFKGNISELVIVPHDLPDTDLQNFNEYARSQWRNLPTQGSNDPCSDANGQPITSVLTIRCDDGNASTYGDHCSAGTCIGSVPPAGSPAELQPLAWYHANAQEVITRENGVETWFDRGPHHFDLCTGFSSGRPSLSSDGWSAGKPTITFGGHSSISRHGWTGTPAGTDEQFTLLAVLQPKAAQTVGIASWWSGDGHGRVACELKVAGSATGLDLFRTDWYGSTQDFSTTSDVGTAKHVLAYRYAAEKIRLDVDGTSTSSGTLTTLSGVAPDELLVGADGDFANTLLNAEVAELAVIPRAISDAEITNFRRYAYNEWGSLPQVHSFGDACASNGDCDTGLACVSNACACAGGICSSTCRCPVDGGSCNADGECQDGVICRDHMCIPGGNCGSLNPDDRNDCTDDTCTADGLVIHVMRPSGAACARGTCDGYGNCDTTTTTGSKGQPPNSDGTCYDGLVPGVHNGLFFGTAAEANLCWDPACELSALAECGNWGDLCGHCPTPFTPRDSSCTPSCDPSKHCGDNSSDGCGGTCIQCNGGECGCTVDAECGPGFVCQQGAGSRFGCAATANVCVPTSCLSLDPAVVQCGSASDPCGVCEACSPKCDGRTCGPDGCGGECGTCGEGSYCNGKGQCNGDRALDRVPASVADPSEYATQSSGTIAGQFEVSHDGQAQYTIPVVVAPGRGSMQPNLSLSYDSAGANGLMGQGWRLDGLPYIAPCRKTIAQDGFAHGLGDLPTVLDGAADTGDRFCLNGQRLVAISGDYGALNSEYRLELDNLTKVVVTQVDDTPNGTRTVSPTEFKITDTSGHITTLARSTIASLRIWLPQRVDDLSGNFMTIAYDEQELASGVPLSSSSSAAVEIAPRQIWYAGHTDGTEPDSVVEFVYKDRPDPRDGYRAGVYVKQTRLVDKLKVSVGGNLVRQYQFTYMAPRTAGGSVLQKLEECVPSSTGALVCKPPTWFDYDNTPAQLSSRLDIGTNPDRVGSAQYDEMPPFVLDMDGDGVDDMLFPVLDKIPDPKKSLDGIDWHWEILWSGRVEQNLGIEGETASNRTPLQYHVIDYNGDGRDDLLVAPRKGGNYFVLTAGADSVVRVQELPVGVPIGDTDATYVADVDGDGFKDIISCLGPPNTLCSDGSDCPSGLCDVDHQRCVGPFQWRMTHIPDLTQRPIDFHGFCEEHALAMHLDGSDAEQLLMQAYYVNENGQFVDDAHYVAISFQNAGVQQTGDVLTTTQMTSVPVNQSTGAVGMMLDANGDGLQDILVSDPDAGFRTYLATGGSLASGTTTSADPYFVSDDSFNQVDGVAPAPGSFSTLRDEYGEGYTLGPIIDVNGDGRDDILITTPNLGIWRWLKATTADAADGLGKSFAGWTVSALPAPAPVTTWITDNKEHLGTLLAGRGFAVDVNGDGVKDFVQKPSPDYNHPSPYAAYVRTGSVNAKLTAVTDGLGGRVELTYASSAWQHYAPGLIDPIYSQSTPPVYTNEEPGYCGNDHGFRDRVACGVPRSSVVAKERHFQGPQYLTGFYDEFSHHYSDANWGLDGRGWIGYAGHTITQTDTERQLSYSFFNTFCDATSGICPYGYRYYSLRDSVDFYRDDGHQIEKTIDHYVDLSYVRPYPGLKVLATPLSYVVDSSQETDLATGAIESLGEVSHQFPVRDQFNQPKQIATTWVGPHSSGEDELDIEYMYEQDSTYLDKWLIGLPHRRMVTSTGADFESTQAPYTRTMEYDYSPAGLLTRQTVEPDLSDYTVSTSYGRNAYGQAETIDTCGGAITCSGTDKREATIVYDDERHVFPHSLTDAEGYSSILTFDHGLGVVLSTEKHGATGSKVLTGYTGPDGFGRTRVIQEPDLRKTHISYDQASGSDGGLNVTTTTDGYSTLSVGYDQLGRKVHQYQTTLGGTQLKKFWRHDRFGRLQDTTRRATDNVDQFAELTTFTYDVLGRVQSIIPPDPDQPARQSCYDGRVSCGTDARGYTRCIEYDGRGRVHFASAPVNVIEPCSMYLEDVKNFSGMDRNGVEYVYGPFGALERVVDSATGNVLIDVQEDQLGRPQTRTDIGLHQKTYTYTSFGQVYTADDGEHTVTFGYDKLDRKTRRDESDVGTTSWVWRPDLPDRLDYSLTTDGTKTTVDYDAFGRADALTREIGADSLTASVVHWDDFGRAQTIEYPGPNHLQVQNVYDEASGILKEIDSVPPDGSGDAPVPYWKLDSITDFGQVQHETFGNGYTTTRSYHDFTGLPHTIQTMQGSDPLSEIQDLTYDWDEDGNLKTFSDSLGGVSEGYVYDEADRLYTVNQGTTPVKQYGYYDNFGSIYGTDDQGGNGWLYNYTDSPYAVHQITSELGESTFSYSPAGRLSHRSGGLLPELNVDYNPAGKPIKVWGSDESQAIFYGYDADQVKVYKQAPDESALYFGDLYYRIQQSGGLDEHHYVISNGQRGVAEVVVEDGADEPTRIVYLHDDAQDSVQALSTDGTSTETRHFDYFGGNGPDSSSYSLFGYTGHQHESEHGLIDMRGRWYDPQVGQFLSPDPFVGSMVAPEGFNRYAYALNNPFRFTDPSGYQTCDELSEGCGQGGVGTTLPVGPSEPAPASEPSEPYLQGVGGANVMAPSDFAGSEGAYGMSSLTANFSSAAGTELAAMSGGPTASLGERATYLGAGVGVGVGSGYVIGRGVLLVCAATGVCTAGVVAIATVAGTAYLISDLLGDNGTRFVRAFTSAGTASDAFAAGMTLSGGLSAAVTRGALSREAGENIAAQLGLDAGAAPGAGTGLASLGSRINPAGLMDNCGSCAVALDRTLGGSATSAIDSGILTTSEVAATYGKLGFASYPSAASIEQMLLRAGSGARGIVFGGNGAEIGHFFNAVNQGGTVVFLDAQIGAEAATSGYQSFQFLITFRP